MMNIVYPKFHPSANQGGKKSLSFKSFSPIKGLIQPMLLRETRLNRPGRCLQMQWWCQAEGLLLTRCSLIWKIHPSTTSSRLKGSRSGSICRPAWAIKVWANAPASPLNMACPPGPAAAPPAAPKLCSPSAPTVRKRSVLVRPKSALQPKQSSAAGLCSADGWCDWWHHQPGVELQRRRSRAHGPRNPDEQHGKSATSVLSKLFATSLWGLEWRV